MATRIETPVNFLGGSPLNRLSWLRDKAVFLNNALQLPATRWLLFNAGQPLVVADPAQSTTLTARALARLPSSLILPLLGPKPFFGQGQAGGDLADPGVAVLESARHHGPPIAFLGLEEDTQSESGSALPSTEFTVKEGEPLPDVAGTPFFALDVTDIAEEAVESAVRDAGHAEGGAEFKFVEPRSASGAFSLFDAAVFGQARSILDWNTRNKFCPGCGSPVYSIWGGWKLSCSSLLPWSDNTGRKPCPSAVGLNNFAHPRTDPVVIMGVIDEANEKILLGRNRRFPGNFYSCLAGFMEPGEAFEDAVKREIWEEAGVSTWAVRYHSSQPWPYPASLMVGFYATGDPAQPIRLDLDNELADARWFSRAEVRAVLEHPSGSTIRRAEYKKIGEDVDPVSKKKEVELEKAEEVREEPAFRVPPKSAIAGVLINDWVYGKAGAAGGASTLKGNL